MTIQTKQLSHHTYLGIALPFILSTLTQPLLSAVDTAVIGQVGETTWIGGVAVGAVMMNTIYWLFGFFRVSTTGQSAIALGSKCNQRQLASFTQPFILAGIIGLMLILLQAPIWQLTRWLIAPDPLVEQHASIYFFTLIWGAPLVLWNYTIIGWMMGQAKVKETLAIQMVGNALNIILDILFVVSFDLGVLGVAIASLIAQAVTFALGLLLIATEIKLSLDDALRLAKIDKAGLRAIISSNTDLLLRTICILMMFNAMARFGSAMGPTTLATNAIMLQIIFIISYLFDGIANASSVFAGQAVGLKDPLRLSQLFRLNAQWTITCATLISLLLWHYSHLLVHLFTDIPVIISEYSQLHLWLVLFPLLAGFGLTLYGIFTGSGITRPVRNSTALALFTFIASLYLTRDSGNQGLWLSFTLFYVGRGLFLYPFKQALFERCREP